MPFINIPNKTTTDPVQSGSNSAPVQPAQTEPKTAPIENILSRQPLDISNDIVETGLQSRPAEVIETSKPPLLPELNLQVPIQDLSQNLDLKLKNPDISGLGTLSPIESNTSASRVYSLTELLDQTVNAGASDLHITTGYRPMIRVSGALRNLQAPIITREVIIEYIKELVKDRPQYNFDQITELDLTFAQNKRRFRVNIFKQLGNYSAVLRVIPERIPSLEELGLPPVVKEFIKFPNGLVLITGPTGSGKSTTIASLLNLINLTQPKHIITLEDPVEFVLPKGVGLVDQREFGMDFDSWSNALRSLLRQAPDIVLLGEMRDLETVEAALQIAETGHLVFATLHTNSAASSIDRVIDIFPAAKQDQIKVQFASVVRAIVTQKLVRTLDDRRKAVVEILLSNAAVRNAIRENKGYQIDNIIQTGSDVGMVPLEKSLVALVREGSISVDVAKQASLKPQEIDILLNS